MHEGGFTEKIVEAVLGRVRERAFSVFMAVPTVYARIVQALEGMDPADIEARTLRVLSEQFARAVPPRAATWR
mgnify:CR=1 FL=1